MNEFKLLIVASFLLIGLSCRNVEIEDEIPEQPEESYVLKGSKWRLDHYVDIQTDEVIMPTPNGGDNYTLTFESDSFAIGRSVVNIVWCFLFPETRIMVTTEVEDSENGNIQLFYDAIKMVDSFEHNDNELKFFYNDKKNYLLYKLMEQ